MKETHTVKARLSKIETTKLQDGSIQKTVFFETETLPSERKRAKAELRVLRRQMVKIERQLHMEAINRPGGVTMGHERELHAIRNHVERLSGVGKKTRERWFVVDVPDGIKLEDVKTIEGIESGYLKFSKELGVEPVFMGYTKDATT